MLVNLKSRHMIYILLDGLEIVRGKIYIKNRLIKKGLVFSVIILFITVGTQPIFAKDTITSIISESEEDCIECQGTDRYNILRVKLLLIRLKTIINLISLKFDDIIQDKELSSRYNEIIEINEHLKTLVSPQVMPLYCCVLGGIMISLLVPIAIIEFFSSIVERFPNMDGFIGKWFSWFLVPLGENFFWYIEKFSQLLVLGSLSGCWNYP